MKVLSLFSGIGGLDLGFEWAGFETVCFCEIEEFPRKVLNKHWPNVPIIEDVRNVTRESVPRVDVIIGGFPCQDISYAGTGAGIDYDLSTGEGTRSGLWWEYWRVIRELRPRYVVAENVAALTNRGLDTVLGSLAQIGYDAEWQIVSAASVGAPHIRERIFIVAYPQHGSVQVGRGDNGISGDVRRQGNVCANDFREGIEEEVGEVLADTYRWGSQGSRRYVNALNPKKKENREVHRAFNVGGQNQPDWFGGSIGQPHPVSFKNVPNTDSGGLEGSNSEGRVGSDARGSSGTESKDVVNTERKRSGRRGEQQQESVEETGGASKPLYRKKSGRRQGKRGQEHNDKREWDKRNWVEIEYDFRGVAYGVSDRVGALKGYGNAVVPQVAYLVARAVREHAEENGYWNETI